MDNLDAYNHDEVDDTHDAVEYTQCVHEALGLVAAVLISECLIVRQSADWKQQEVRLESVITQSQISAPKGWGTQSSHVYIRSIQPFKKGITQFNHTRRNEKDFYFLLSYPMGR